jgi:ketopantoate reductase
MNILIYGAGAIGSHLTYCLDNNTNNIAIITKDKYLRIFKKKGINIKIFSNDKIKKKLIIKENKNIQFYSSTNDLSKNFIKNINAIFITIKLKDFSKKIEKNIFSLANKNTSIIPPCTYLSRWWFYSLFAKRYLANNNKKFSEYIFFKKYLKNIVGMTMWLSGKVVKPGFVEIRHIQRGYPIKEFNIGQSKNVTYLRKVIKKKCISPRVKNIFSELYIKAINSFAFNLIALKTEMSNRELLNDKEAIKSINKIFLEFDKIIKSMGLPILQSKISRIKQTLSSTSHILSMLHDYKKNKKVELPYLWSTLELLSNLTNQNIKYSKKVYTDVLKKIK